MLPMGRMTSGSMAGSSLGASDPRGSLTEESDFETYLLLLLSDSNLPTGGFVASSGLESFHAHGLLHTIAKPPTHSHDTAGVSSSSATAKRMAPSQAELSSATLSFARSTLHSYSRSSFSFLARVHACVAGYLDSAVQAQLSPNIAGAQGSAIEGEARTALQACLDDVSRLDKSYHSLLLNHVARRASKAQGIALLTLYAKAFAKPIDLERQPFDGSRIGQRHAAPSQASDPHASTQRAEERRIELAAQLVDRLKMDVRRSSAQAPGSAQLGPQGHLPICWGVFAACLGISLRKSLYLHLFLQARALFSSSIRLNTLGPYLAHQIMRFHMRTVVNDIIQEMDDAGCMVISPHPTSSQTLQPLPAREVETGAYTIEDEPPPPPQVLRPRTGKPFRNTGSMASPAAGAAPAKIGTLRVGKGVLIAVDDDDPHQGWAWDWPEDQDPSSSAHDPEHGFWTTPSAPATTFPLGEIIQARHDQLHSRLFNS